MDSVGQLQVVEGIDELLGLVYGLEIFFKEGILIHASFLEPFGHTGLVTPAVKQTVDTNVLMVVGTVAEAVQADLVAAEPNVSAAASSAAFFSCWLLLKDSAGQPHRMMG